MLLPRRIHCLLSALFASLAVVSCAAAQESPLGSIDPTSDDFSALRTNAAVDPLADKPTPLAAREAFAKGQQLLADGDAAGAVAQLNAVIAADPAFALGHVARARGLSALGQERSAIRAYAKALALAPSAPLRPTIYFERGRVYYDSGDHQKALDDFDRAAEMRPGDADIAYQRGQALSQLAAEELATGRQAAAGATLRRAVTALDHALELRPDFADALALRGSARADLGELDKAIEDLLSATAIEIEDSSLKFQLAILYLHRANDARALGEASSDDRRADLSVASSLLEHAVNLPANDKSDEPLDHHRARLTLAAAQVELASLREPDARAALYDSAIANCLAVIKEEPRNSAAHFQQAIALRLSGRYREAIVAFTETLRLAPKNTEAHIRRGIAWFYLDEYDLATLDFRAVGLVPGDPRPMFWIGVIHARRGDHLEAIRAYSEAVDENPRYRLAYTNRAISLMHLGHFQRAIDDWNRLIQLDPSDASAYQRRGLAQVRLRQEREAQRSFAKPRARLAD